LADGCRRKIGAAETETETAERGIGPFYPIGVRIACADVDVGGEGNDGDLDVAGVRCKILQLLKQLVRSRLERRDLVVLRHRSGVVEDEGDLQLRRTPACGRGYRKINLI
jgi:hypothetical protein